MGRTITRRQAALLLSQTLMAGPILAVESSAPGPKEVQGRGAEVAGPGERPKAPVYIVLWFDIGDYILPASDDATKRVIDFLTRQGIRATFKIVGEKARALERRRRMDVIAALRSQEIGFNANTHSQQPTPAQYESVLDWELGAEEFHRREHPGFEDIHRIFGRPPTCYGQPGASWAPQSFPTLKKWGIHIYLDDGLQVQLDGRPFWYGGLLNIFHVQAGQQLEPDNNGSNLEQAKADFRSLYAEISARPPGGLISFMFHPTEFVSKEFWDVVNFARGANPPPSEWKRQPEKSPAQREQAFQYFEGLITYIKSFPDVRFLTASEALVRYRDTAQGRVFGTGDLAEIASRVNTKITFQVHDHYALSASEAFSLLNSFVAGFVSQHTRESVKLDGTPYGPSSRAYGVTMPESNMEIPWSQFSRTAIDVNGYLEKRGAIPNAVWYGSTAITPESYLLALGKVTQALVSSGQPPDFVPVLAAELTAAQWVATDSAATWDWPIFPPGFHSSHLIDLARLQAWTLKPAILESTR